MTRAPLLPACTRRVPALVLFVVGMAVATAAAGEGGFISAPEAQESASAGELLLFDIRSPREWRATGVPEDAIPVTIHQPGGLYAFYQKILKAAGGEKDRPIALICAAGGRSTRAQQYLASQGFTNVYNVVEGMLGRGDHPGWLERGLPVKPCKRC